MIHTTCEIFRPSYSPASIAVHKTFPDPYGLLILELTTSPPSFHVAPGDHISCAGLGSTFGEFLSMLQESVYCYVSSRPQCPLSGEATLGSWAGGGVLFFGALLWYDFPDRRPQRPPSNQYFASHLETRTSLPRMTTPLKTSPPDTQISVGPVRWPLTLPARLSA